MTYPQDILPKSEFKKINETQDLTGFFLMRGTPDKDIFDPSTEQIKNKYLEDEGQEKRFLSWSCNLFNLFQTEYLKFRVHNKSMTHHEWDYISEVEVPSINKDYTILENYGCYFIDIFDILSNLSIPYTKEKIVDAKAKPKVVHMPTPCNFWHFELQWVDKAGDPISNKNMSTWKNNLVATMKSYLRNYCKSLEEIDENSIPSLPESAYLALASEEEE